MTYSRQWLHQHLQLIIVGPTGVGKTFLASVLADCFCQQGHTVRYFRTADLLMELKLAKADGSFPKWKLQLATFTLLILDDWLRVLWLPSRFQLDLNQTPIALRTATRQTSPDKSVNCLCTTASFTVFPEPKGFVVLCQLAPGLSRPSMTFLFVGSQICRWLPSDPSSRKYPCLKLGVVIARIVELIIWMLVLLQGTFTPLVHARAGRTQRPCTSTAERCWL